MKCSCMNKASLSLLLFSFFLCICKNNGIAVEPIQNHLQLELVQVLFRHGARTPIECEAHLLRGVSNESSYEPWGYSQLTNEGKLQEYLIGQMLRNRYATFLPETYKREHVYAYSSDVSRTKMSLSLVLAALYPPVEELIWKDDLKWNPIPIHSNPRPLDILNKARNCPQYIEELRKVLSTKEMSQKSAEHDYTLEMIEKIYGKLFDYGRLFCLYNAILIQKNLNMSLPVWCNEDIYQKLVKAAEFHIDSLSSTPSLKRLNGGMIAKRIVENFEKTNRKKLYLYSSHDKNLHAFIKTHDIDLKIIPDYGSAIILEKYRDKNKDVFIKMFMWSGYPKNLETINLKGCTKMCSWNQYLQILNAVLPSDNETMCLFEDLQPSDIRMILNTDSDVIEY